MFVRCDSSITFISCYCLSCWCNLSCCYCLSRYYCLSCWCSLSCCCWLSFLNFFILSHNSCKVRLTINRRWLGPAYTCFSQGKKQPAISKYFTLIFLVSQLPMMSVTDADLSNLFFFLTSGRTISSHKRQEIWLNSFVPRLPMWLQVIDIFFLS